MSRRALVTGGAGFIGSHLCHLLVREGWHVRVLDDFSTGRPENIGAAQELVEGDVRDPDTDRAACEGVNVVFHLAARVSIRNSIDTFCEDADTNLMGTLRIMRAASLAGVQRMVLTSSMAVYGDSKQGSLVREDHALEPRSPYGISKLTAERYLQMMAPELNLEPVVLRLFNTYGTRQGYTPYVGVITIFATRLLRGEPCIIFGDGEQRRDYVHVGDVAKAFLLAGTHTAAPGHVFNVGTGVATSVNELARLVQEHAGAGTFTHEPAHPAELRHSVANISRARSILGYEPQASVATHLHEVVDFIRSQVTEA